MTGRLDRDAARDVLINAYGGDPDYPVEDGGVLDALEGCVRPAPAQTIDRDALIEFMLQIGASDQDHARRRATYVETVCVRPIDGVTLTREEAALAASALRFYSVNVKTLRGHSERLALAARLEAAS